MEETKHYLDPYTPRQHYPNVQMEIVTFADLWERTAVVVDFIDRVLQTFDPFHAKFETLLWSRSSPRLSRPRTVTFLSTGKRWADTRQLLLSGEVARIVMYDWEATHAYDRGVSDHDAYLAVHFGEPWEQARGHRMTMDAIFDPREAKLLVMSFSTRRWQGQLPPEIQAKTAELAVDLFRSVSGACGYVDVCDQPVTLGSRTPYEWQVGMTEPNTRRLWQDVRGVFWGNLLSALHVRQLGGSELVRRTAPCYKVISLDSREDQVADEEALYLQVTPTLEKMELQDHTRMQSFLAPILISSRDQVGITVLSDALVTSEGDATQLRQNLAGSVQRAVVLPKGAILLEYETPAGWPRAYQALQQMIGGTARGYRTIPQLRSMGWSDDAAVWTLPQLILPHSRKGSILPAILVQPYILSARLELAVYFVSPPTGPVQKQMTDLVQAWCTLQYDTETGLVSISYCSVPDHKDGSAVWQVDLEPVGQDAYFQLVLMLDEFSKTTARLDAVHVRGWVENHDHTESRDQP